MSQTAIRRLVRAGRKVELTWRCLFNFAPTIAYKLNHDSLDGEAQRVLVDLNREGIAITSASALLGSNSLYDELANAVAMVEHDVADQIEAARAASDDDSPYGSKSFVYYLLGESPTLDSDSIYARFALQSTILKIANGYLGMCTRLRYYNVWHTFATSARPRQSQLWHRDREDHYIFKVFVYLSDVDDGAGPFTYAARTHAKGGIGNEPAYLEEADGVRRTDDAQMAEVVPSRHWRKGTGPAGTIVFADTRGYHKGGEARESDRVLYTCMFTSPASESREFFRRPARAPRPQSLELAFALAPPRRGPWLSFKF